METWFREVRSVMPFLQTKIFPHNLPLSDKGCVIKEWWNWSMSNVSKGVQHTSLMTVASRRPTHKDGCEGIPGERTNCGQPMSHYLRCIRYIGPVFCCSKAHDAHPQSATLSCSSSFLHPGRIACCPAPNSRPPATKALHTICGNNTSICKLFLFG